MINPDRISNPTGGLGTFLREVYKRIKDEVDFYVLGYPDENSGIENYIGVVNMTGSGQHGGVNGLFAHAIYMRHALEFPKPDIVHATDWTVYLACVLLAEYWEVPLVVTMQGSCTVGVKQGIYYCHDVKSVDGLYIQAAHEALEKSGLSAADKIIGASEGYMKYFPEYKDKTTVIPMGVETTTPASVPELPGDRKYKAAYMGRLALIKGVDAILNTDFPEEIDLIIVGSEEGADATCLELLKNKNSLSYYHLPRMYGQELIDFMAAVDIVIMPSRHEPFGATALDTLAAQTILISSRVDGLGDYLTDYNSILTDVTKEGIEKALAEFLDMSEDQRKAMGLNGFITAQSYTWEKSAQMHLELYKSLV